MSNNGPVTAEEATKIIFEWARLHDLQAGLSEFMPYIAEEGFYMRFDGNEWIGYSDFEKHQIMKRRFFNEVHEYYDIDIVEGDEKTTATTKMNWAAHYRPENSPKSQLIKAYLEHLWEFRRCQKTGRPYMQGHSVELFEYIEGFAPDEENNSDPHLDNKWNRRD